MASRSMFTCLAFLLVLCFVLMEDASDCNTGYGCFYTKPSVSLMTQNRKVLAGLEEKRESVKVGLQGSATSVNGGSFVGYELRNVPSGPDPLHHNRASPEKPRTP
ncbi:uncharacterized protein LOC142607314 [Castanea sativa]|uniref:uncharacterized protein LOC142607314 n=1 Tax=Castanea sativa TaxID=21020 RepID=UPI003ADF0D5B